MRMRTIQIVIMVMLMTLVPSQVRVAKAQTNGSFQVPPPIIMEEPEAWVRVQQWIAYCRSVLTGAIKVKNMDSTHSIFVHNIALDLYLATEQQQTIENAEYFGIVWSWTSSNLGGDEVKPGYTENYAWITTIPSGYWHGTNVPYKYGWVKAHVFVDSTSKNPPGYSKWALDTAPASFFVACHVPLTTTTYSTEGQVTTEITEAAATTQETPSNCFYYLLNQNWDEFVACILGINQIFSCFIATATYGSPMAPEVQLLRGFRDGYVLNTFSGRSFMLIFNAFYYSFSPGTARVIARSYWLKEFMQVALRPLIAIMGLAYYVNLQLYPFDSEAAILLSGLIVSSLIGLIYFSPLAALLAWRSRTLRRSITSRRMNRMRLLLLSCLVALVILSTLLRFLPLASVATFLSSTLIIICTAILPTQLWLKTKHD